MKDFKYNFIGRYDVSNLLEMLNTKSEGDWNYWTLKQRKYKAHSETQTIPLLVDERYGYNGEVKGTESKFYIEFQKELLNIIEVIQSYYGVGEILAIEIAKLPKKSKVLEHKDSGISLLKNPRVHLVLQTNDDVIFTVDTENKNMKVGEMWEINNTKSHSVSNNGNIDRIHMIIDYKKIQSRLL